MSYEIIASVVIGLFLYDALKWLLRLGDHMVEAAQKDKLKRKIAELESLGKS